MIADPTVPRLPYRPCGGLTLICRLIRTGTRGWGWAGVPVGLSTPVSPGESIENEIHPCPTVRNATSR